MNLPYLAAAQTILHQIDATQYQAIQQAACQMAGSIADDGLVYVFGAGHSALAAAEVYPKCGNIVGFQALLEVSLIYFTNVIGSNGISQFTFLERAEGYGRAILDSYVLKPQDTLWIFSQSGVNPLVIDVALTAREKGLKVVAVTACTQCRQSAPRHSSGSRLVDLADILIDNCVPVGDVTLQIEGLQDAIGPASTLANIAIANAVVVETARALLQRGVQPVVNPSLNAPAAAQGGEQRMHTALKEFRRRAQRS